MKSIKITSFCVLLRFLVGCSSTGNTFPLIAPTISAQPLEYSLIRSNQGMGFIDKTGRVVVQPKYSNAKPFSDGLAAVEVTQENGEKLWGFINDKNEFVIKPQYVIVDSFANKLALVLPKNVFKSVFIDQRGNIAIPSREDLRFTASFSEGFAPVYAKDKWGLIDTTGKVIVEPKFDYIRNFSNGLAFVSVGKGFNTLGGYIDRAGHLAVPLTYKQGTNFVGDIALVSSGVFSYLSLIDRHGNIIKQKIDGSCGQIEDDFSGNLLPARLELSSQKGFFRNDGCGYLDAQGNIAIPPNPKVEKAGTFSEGLAPVKINSKWGYIDRLGNVLITPKFETVTPFHNGLAYATVNAAESGYINHSGQFVWRPVSF